MKTEYDALIEAAQVLERCKTELSRADGTYTSPAWKMVHHAQNHVTMLANEVLRSPTCDDWIMRIGSRVYEAYELGVIDFDTCEISLNSLSSCAENIWLGIPEPNDGYITLDSAVQS